MAKKNAKEKDSPLSNRDPRDSVQVREITAEMKESYLSYAMSVIVARALPDVRDGLKPVQRRILYAMYGMGLRPGSKTVKSARVVGEVLGKYHPHGDMAVYDTLVRLAQPFSLRYPLVTGQGNFGSIDGDPPAASRYTEAKISQVAEELLTDLEKDTVDFQPNYDNTLQEPKVLPAKVPNLLINGCMGIAVGMATSIPPHNLQEVSTALKLLLQNPEATTQDLLEVIKGPDFPTGGAIYNREDILSTYGTGKGSIVMRGKAEIVERRGKKDEFDIVISEIPYEVNKATLVAKIAQLVEDKKIEGIKDIRDESDKDGLRVVVELKSSSQPKRILNQLYHYTDLEKKFHFNMLALLDGIQPKTLSLKEILVEFLKHRRGVVLRRTNYELARTKDRIHILEGLAQALDNLDAVIKTIRQAASRDKAKQELMAKFKLSDKQSEAILLMRLEQLAKLEREKIFEELKEKQALAKELQSILDNPKKLVAVLDKELDEVSAKYGEARRTEIYSGQVKELKEEELIAEKQSLVALSKADYIKRLDASSFRVQKRGGKGITGFETKNEEDSLSQVVSCSSHDLLLLFTNSGKIFFLKAYDIPEASRVSRGKPVNNFINLAGGERIATFIAHPYKADKEKYAFLILVTKHGIIKKVELKEILERARSGIRILNLKKDDEVIGAAFSSGKDEMVLVSRQGKAIRFPETQVRSQGRTAQGIKGIGLAADDFLVGAGVVRKEQTKETKVLVVTENGYGKMTPLKEYRIQSRGGKGIRTVRLSDKTGQVVAGKSILLEEELIAASLNGQTIRLALSDIRVLGRDTQGVRIMSLDKGDKLISTTVA